MILVIAEKPDLGKAIAAATPGGGKYNAKEQIIQTSFHNEEMIICWCAGHFLTLKDPEDYDEKYKKWAMEDLPIYFPNWGHKVIESKKFNNKARVAQIGALIKKARVVVNAGDIDEEGQLLIDEILDWHHYDKTKAMRLDTNDTCPAAMAKALERMTPNAGHVADGVSAFGRQLCDKVFGYNLTRYYTLLNGGGKVLPVGRVKMPTLGLVVARDMAIEGHKTSYYYTLDVNVDVNQKIVPAHFVPAPNDPHLDDGKILDKNYLVDIARRISNIQLPQISITKSQVLQAPPLPFNQTKLFAACETLYGMKPTVTAAVTQALRDKYSAITYNRSDCQYLGEETFNEAPTTIPLVCKNMGLDTRAFDTSIKSKCFNDANLTAHTAIIPTQSEQDLSKFTDNERKVYELVAKYYLVQFIPPCQKEITRLSAPSVNGGKIEASSTRIVKPGYLSFLKGVVETENADNTSTDGKDTSALDGMNAGTYRGITLDTEVIQRETKPPQRYTQSTLIEDMTRISKYCDNEAVKKLLLQKDKGKKGENGSIGTSATRSQTIAELVERGYLREEVKGKKTYLISTQLGREFYQILPDSVRKVDVSAKWWWEQEKIKAGEMTPDDMAKDVMKTVNAILQSGAGRMKNAETYSAGATSSEIIGKCPNCGQDVVEGSNSFRCRNRDCRFQLYKDNKFFASLGKKLTAKTASDMLKDKKVTLKGCKSKAGNKYDAVVICDFSGDYPSYKLEFANQGKRKK